MKYYKLTLAAIALISPIAIATPKTVAQPIVPANDGTNTVVTPEGNQLNITGGQISGNGDNLFHSFQQFGLSENQIANFLSSPNIRNILGRVSGGDPSMINGLIQITGGSSNLFLMNPAGIVFGPNAALNIPANFTATTATSIGFESGMFHGFGANDYSDLVGDPQFFDFSTLVPGSIVNQAHLTTQLGHDLSLIGGTVINTGFITAPQGNLLIATVPGENRIRISQPGHLLSLELPLNLSSEVPMTPLSLPQLLAGGSQEINHATKVSVNENGEVVLSGSGSRLEPGDIVVVQTDSSQQSIASQDATLSAANNLFLSGSQLETTGNLNLLAGNTLQIRDNNYAFFASAGGDLTLQGNRAIDIVALNHPDNATALQSLGDITFISPEISLDTHLSAENVAIFNQSGESGDFISLYDPIFSANGDVNFGNYTGRSLKIEAGGQIVGGNITITGPDTTLTNSTDPDAAILRSSAALILRSGVSSLANAANLPPDSFAENTLFAGTEQPSGNNISVGFISTAGGPVILDSPNEIFADRIVTGGGDITVNAIGDIQLNGSVNSGGGNIDITTGNFLRVLSSFTNDNGVNASISSAGNNGDGSITIRHQGSINTPFIIGDATTNGTEGAIASNSEVISPTFEVPVPPSVYTQGNITIITSAPGDNTEAILPPPEPLPETDGATDGNPDSIPVAPAAIDNDPVVVSLEPSAADAATDAATDGRGDAPVLAPDTATDTATDSRGDAPVLAPDTATDTAADTATDTATDEVSSERFSVSDPATDVATDSRGDAPVLAPDTAADTEISLETETVLDQDLQRKTLESLENPGALSREQILALDLSILPLSFASEEVGAIGSLFPIENSSVVSTITEFSSVNDAALTNTGAGVELTASFSQGSEALANINSASSANGTTNGTNATTGVFVAAMGDRLQASSTTTASSTATANNSASASSSSSSQDQSSSTSNQASIEQLRETMSEGDMVGTVWQIEQLRNQEIEELFGIRANLDEQEVAITAFQNTLKKLAAETGKEVAIIYVVAQTEQLELILVTSEGTPLRTSVPEATRDVLFPVVQEFRNEVTDPRSRTQTSYLDSAQQLYQWLIFPLEETLTDLGIETLMFSMGQGMRSLPIAALHDGQQFLIEKYSISLIPSFSLTNTQYKSIKNAQVLAMGISEFTEFHNLPAVPTELATVIEQLGKGTSLLNDNFTFDNLTTQREENPYPILHLATHADFKSGDPSNSFVQLWDRKLTIDKMPQMGWSNPPVELLVLSACRTAVGDRNAELGFAGLAVLSGAKSALASLWYISDEGTLALMSEFYQQLAIAPVKAEALQQAQIAMISSQVRVEGDRLLLLNFDKEISLPPELADLRVPNLNHPYFWSAFIIIGSPW